MDRQAASAQFGVQPGGGQDLLMRHDHSPFARAAQFDFGSTRNLPDLEFKGRASVDHPAADIIGAGNRLRAEPARLPRSARCSVSRAVSESRARREAVYTIAPAAKRALGA